MATDAYVGVTDDPGADKFIDNREVNTNAGAVLRQVVTLGDPDLGAARAKITNATPGASAYGLTVRPTLHAIDSGLLSLPATVAAAVGVTFDCIGVFLSNITDHIEHVTITDGDGGLYLDQFPLEPRAALFLPFGGVTFVDGLKWFADHVSSVQGQVKGD